MNTSAVAKMLGVSPSTIQRWVKQADLQMERTELGHYQFSEESIEVLKDIQKQLNSGVLLQDLKLKGKKTRKAIVVPPAKDELLEKINQRMDQLENKLNGKADDVVSYQILQHRRELEDMQNEISRLNEIIESLHQTAAALEVSAASEEKPLLSPIGTFRKLKKRNFISSFLGL
jgi:chromosome-anchoring protein RacA